MITISTQAVSAALRQSVLHMQSDLAKAQKEASTGRLADTGLALGRETGRSVSLRQEQSRLQTVTATNAVVATRLSSTQSALDGILSTAQSFLASLVGSSSDASGAPALQVQAKSNLQSLTSSMNTTVQGQYIFGGINSDVKPMTDYFQTPAAGSKQAVDSAFQSAFGMSQSDADASAISASDMQSFLGNQFLGLFQGASWSTSWSAASSQAVRSRISSSELIDSSVSANQPAVQKLAMAYTMMAEFSGQHLSDAASQAVVSSATQAVSEAVQELTNVQAGVGVAQAAVTNANDQMSVQMNVLSTAVDNLESVDPYAVSTQVSQLQTQIEASYEMTNKLQQLSLVDYLAGT